MTRVLYITGLGRSGSTLLDRLLGRVDGVTAHGELARIWSRGLHHDAHCACGARFHACPFWDAVGRRAYGGWDRVDPAAVDRDRHRVDRLRHLPRLARGGHRPPAAAALRRRVDLLQRLYAGLAAVAGADVVVDSSKDVSTAVLLAQADELDVRFVHLVRDARGVAHSWARQVARPDAEPGEAPELDRYGPVRVATRYLAYNLVLSSVPGITPRLLVRYEDLARDPTTVVRRVAAHAGLAPAAVPSHHDPVVRLGPGHRLAGNPMRLSSGPVHVQLDEAWRASMPPGRRAVVTALTAPLLTAYGYLPPDGRWVPPDRVVR